MSIQLDDGVQFGLGFFETICLRGGKPEFLKKHLDRINSSLAYFGISQRVTEEEVDEWLQRHAEELNKAEDPAAMKIMVSDQNKQMLLRHNPYTEDVIARGFCLDYSAILRNETSPLVSHKSMNYGDNILEKRATKGRGIDEVIFLNSKGEVTEGSTTNLFFVRNGRIMTPNKFCGLLPGVMRAFVMEKFPVEESCIYPADVAGMDECFVTNSLMGIMPVTRIGEQAYPIGPVTREIQKCYKTSLQRIYEGCLERRDDV